MYGRPCINRKTKPNGRRRPRGVRGCFCPSLFCFAEEPRKPAAAQITAQKPRNPEGEIEATGATLSGYLADRPFIENHPANSRSIGLPVAPSLQNQY